MAAARPRNRRAKAPAAGTVTEPMPAAIPDPDPDTLAAWTATEHAITRHAAAAAAAFDERTVAAKTLLGGWLNYALTEIATRRPGFMGVYYQVAQERVFDPPSFVDPRAATVVLPAVPALPAPPTPPPVEIVDAELMDVTEQDIVRSLIAAQQHADQTVNDAKHRAREIVADAEARAAGMAKPASTGPATTTFLDAEEVEGR